jgi:hypothetical protein
MAALSKEFYNHDPHEVFLGIAWIIALSLRLAHKDAIGSYVYMALTETPEFKRLVSH